MDIKHLLKSINVEFINKGAAYIKDDDVEKVVHSARDIKYKVINSDMLQRFYEDVKMLIAMIRDYWNGVYCKIPWWVIAAVVFALLYVLNPFDLIPDILPVLGLADDTAVLAICLAMTEKDILEYQNWKGSSRQIEEV